MSLDAILDGIRKSGRKQISEINSSTTAKIESLQQKAFQDVNTLREKNRLEGKMRLSKEEALIEQQTKLKTLQVFADARQKLIEVTLDKVQKDLNGFRTSPQYPGVLNLLIQEALDELRPSLQKGQLINLLVDARDIDLVSEQVKQFSDVILKKEINCCGGCIAQSDDGRVIVLNTLDARFARILLFLQTRLAVYFDQKAAA